VGSITRSAVEEIAKQKLNDLNAANLEGATRIIEGTARSMGIEVVEG
jgi:large subunit ribosomal protein L11